MPTYGDCAAYVTQYLAQLQPWAGEPMSQSFMKDTCTPHVHTASGVSVLASVYQISLRCSRRRMRAWWWVARLQRQRGWVDFIRFGSSMLSQCTVPVRVKATWT